MIVFDNEHELYRSLETENYVTLVSEARFRMLERAIGACHLEYFPHAEFNFLGYSFLFQKNQRGKRLARLANYAFYNKFYSANEIYSLLTEDYVPKRKRICPAVDFAAKMKSKMEPINVANLLLPLAAYCCSNIVAVVVFILENTVFSKRGVLFF